MRQFGRLGGIALVVLFLAVDVVLVSAAWRHAGGGGATSDKAASSSTEQTPTPGSSSPTKPNRSAPVKQTVFVSHPASVRAATTRPAPLLSAVSPSSALFANAGCKGQPKLKITTDGGSTRTALAAPTSHVLRIVQTSSTSAWMIAADSTCTPAYFSTVDGGTSWLAEPDIGQVWVPLPTGVQVPLGGLVTPCGTKHPQPVSFSAADDHHALVVCRRGTFRTTTAGTSWHPVGALPAGRPAAVALVTQGRGLMLLAHSPHCAGISVARTHDGGKSWKAAKCLSKVRTPAALSLQPSGVAMVADRRLASHSTNFGRTWSLAKK
jgi:hypothetical protein